MLLVNMLEVNLDQLEASQQTAAALDDSKIFA